MKKNFFLWIILGSLAMVCLVLIISLTFEYRDVERERAALQLRRDFLAAENARLAHEVSLDVTDEYIIAQMRKLGYYFPGEKVMIYHDAEESEGEE